MSSQNLAMHVKHPAAQATSPSISASSLDSHDSKPAENITSIPEEPTFVPPTATDPSHQVSSLAPTSKRPGMTSRLTRMFSSTNKSPLQQSEKHEAQRESKIELEQNGTTGDGGRRSQPLSRQSSNSEKRAGSVTTGRKTPPTEAKGKEAVHPPRFRLLQEGGHEHYLKSNKRQEKLSNMLREMVGAKKKDDHDEHQQLSLMSSWVDQLKTERDKLAADKKGGPNSTATLVEKYGKCQEIVGRGAFGIVRISHKADPKDSKTEQLYAVKEFRRRPQESPKKYQKRLTSEFCISSSLRHPNVIHTLDLLQDAKGDYCEVMEFCAGGDLYTLVLAAGKLEPAEADCYFKQMMRGVEYMHEMGVAHRDLKPENLLLTMHGSLKITDFGNGECFRMAWETEAHMTAGLCGSAPYIAPEEYVDQEFDPRAVDLWATGVIYMAMRTGRHLWRVARKDEDEFYERYLQGRKDEDGYQPIETLHRVSGNRYPFTSPSADVFRGTLSKCHLFHT